MYSPITVTLALAALLPLALAEQSLVGTITVKPNSKDCSKVWIDTKVTAKGGVTVNKSQIGGDCYATVSIFKKEGACKPPTSGQRFKFKSAPKKVTGFDQPKNQLTWGRTVPDFKDGEYCAGVEYTEDCGIEPHKNNAWTSFKAGCKDQVTNANINVKPHSNDCTKVWIDAKVFKKGGGVVDVDQLGDCSGVVSIFEKDEEDCEAQRQSQSKSKFKSSPKDVAKDFSGNKYLKWGRTVTNFQTGTSCGGVEFEGKCNGMDKTKSWKAFEINCA